ncbi:MAG TPA: AAA family ATPase [Chloroflexaceae bacterium]|nr:AAA family ATPase [Chloroflexaceae bacterium]
MLHGKADQEGEVGIDFDGCRDEPTGEIAPWAQVWIERLISRGYADVSPSQAGVKFIVRGAIPKALRHALGQHEGIEIYAWGRCFTMTGQRLPGCADEPLDAQEVLDDLFTAFGKQQPAAPEPPVAPVAELPVISPAGDDWRAMRAKAIDMRIKQWVAEKLEWMRVEMAVTTGMRHNKRLELGRLGGGLIATAPHCLTDEEVLATLFHAKPPEAHVATELQAIRDGIAHGKRSPLPLPFALPTDHAPLIRDGRAWCPSCSSALLRSRYPYLQVAEPGWYCPRCKGAMAWPLAAWHGPAPLGDEPPSSDEVAWPARPGSTLIHASRIGEAVERITWLIPGLLGLNAISQLFAPGGSGKSLLALDQALCVAQVAPVVYVAAEAAGEQEERIAAWCAHHGLDVGQLYFWPKPLTLKDAASVDSFLAEVREVRPSLIVIDPLASCMVGLEESSTGDMQIAVDALNTIRRATGAAINVVHHTGWSTEHERGSSVLRNACRVVIKLTTDDSGLMTLTCEKANNGRPFEARYFRLVEAGTSVTLIPASKVTTRNAALTVKHIAILEALSLQQHRDGASFTQILDYTEQGKSTLHKGINRLLERSLIARERQTYSLTDEGRAELATAAQATEFAGSPAQVHGELRVNWAVNVVRSEGELRHQDAEFTQFTAQEAPVHPEGAPPVSAQFTSDSASQCARSPQFTPSSPSSSPHQFTSSPLAPPLRGAGSERETSEPATPALAEGTTPTTATSPLPEGWTVHSCDVRGWVSVLGTKFLARGPNGEQTEPCDSEGEARFWARRMVDVQHQEPEEAH